MTRYQLAKLIDMAGAVRTRKRLQKIVYLLQAANCPLEADFRLHYYGTYSKDVADLVNEMVQCKLIVEASASNGVGTEYSYTLDMSAQESLISFEATERGRIVAAALERFGPQLQRLVTTDLRELELASTIVFYWKRTRDRDWDKAVKETGEFKSEPLQSEPMRKSLELARQVLSYPGRQSHGIENIS